MSECSSARTDGAFLRDRPPSDGRSLPAPPGGFNFGPHSVHTVTRVPAPSISFFNVLQFVFYE